MLLAFAFLILTLLTGVFVGRRLFDKNLALYAIPVGLVFSAWLLFAVSMAIGFTEISIVLVCLLEAAFILLDYHRNAVVVRQMSASSRSLLPVIVISFFAFFLLNHALLSFDSKGQLVGNGLDLGFYLSMTSSMAQGNFPPQYPIMSGEPLSYYHFLFFYSAALVKGGMPLLWAFNAYFILLWVALVGILFRIVHKLIGSQSTSYLAVFLFLFCGGLAFTVHLAGFDFSNPKAVESLLSNPKFFLQYRSYGFPVTNLFTTGLVTRPDVAGLVFFLTAAVYAVFSKQRSQRGPSSILLAGIFFGLTGMFNLPLALVTLSFLFCYFLLSEPPKLAGLRWKWWPFVAGAAIALAVQFPLLSPKLAAAVSHSSSLFQPFWFLSGTPFQDPLSFWLANFGAFVLLGIVGFLLSPAPLRKMMLAIVPSFLFVNFFQPFVWPINNIKLIGPLFLILIVLTVYALLRIWRFPWVGKPIALLLILPLTLTGYLSVMSMLHWAAIDLHSEPICFADDVVMANFVAANTPQGSVFIADPQAEVSCLAALSGRLTYSSNNFWVDGHGFDLAKRNRKLENMLDGNCTLIQESNATFALEDLRHGWKLPDPLKQLSAKIWSQGGLSVYQITGC